MSGEENRNRLVGMTNPLLGEPVAPGVWRVELDTDSFSYLADHRLQGMIVLPGSVYIEIALAAASAFCAETPVALENILFERLFLMPEGDRRSLQAMVLPGNEREIYFRAYSRDETRPESPFETLNATATVRFVPADETRRANPDELRPGVFQEVSGKQFYAQLSNRGNQYGPAFQAVKHVWLGNTEALGRLELPGRLEKGAESFNLHPVVLDTSLQLLASFDRRTIGAIVLAGIEQMRILGSPGTRWWVQARLRGDEGEQPDSLSGDVRLVDDAGQVAVELSGVRFKRLGADSGPARESPPAEDTIAITATFTAEPLEDSLSFWMRTLQTPTNIVFAPYNQVFQQLLDPSGTLSKNRGGLNVILLRLSDWARQQYMWESRLDSFERERLFAGLQKYTLPNHIEIAHLNPYETEFMYEEIFVNCAYLKHGITLKPDDCVFDVGANIGLFALFASRRCREGSVYAFEPSEAAYKALSANSSLYGANIKAFNFGLSNRCGEAPFTFYRNSSVFSGFHADAGRDKAALRAIIGEILARHSSPDTGPLGDYADDLLAGRLEGETYSCQLRRLSDIIREQNVERIDLLKIDAEGSELEVLEGIEERDWDRIKQIVIEVHDRDGRGRRLARLLDERGFHIAIDREELLGGAGLYNLYASRQPETAHASSGTPSAPGSDRLIEENLTELIKSLKSPHRPLDTVHLLVVCPPPPALIRDERASAFFSRMEQRLAYETAGLSNIHIISSSELLNAYPVSRYYDPHADELGHIPYTPEFFAAMGSLIARRYHALRHRPYKAILLDCDNTLWRGICGEDGPSGVEIDPPRKWLQEFIVKQHDAGMLICLCSRNNEEDVFEVFKRNPEMPLKRDNILAWRINWAPKSSNIRALAEELNLGLDSIIFLDDDPAECAEVRASCPEVIVLQLPDRADDIPGYLDHIWAFDKPSLTEEDKRRSVLYKQEMRREASRQSYPTLASFLESLQLQVRIFVPVQNEAARIAQLTQRTNQFNLTTIRRSEGEIRELIETRKLECLAVEASDRFGDYGLVGVMLFGEGSAGIAVDTFLLSCRALGKGIEHRMLARLGEIALERGHSYITITFSPSGRNEPALWFLNSISREFMRQAPPATPAVQSQQSPAGVHIFRFPASLAARLMHSSRAAEPFALPAETPETAPANGPKGGRLSADPSSLYHRIAGELREANAILKAIESEGHPAKRLSPRVFQPPSNGIERAIAEVWQRVLGVEQVGIDVNFFDVGGTSLKAVQVVAQLKRIFGAAIPLVKLFEKTTISSMARLLRHGAGEAEAETRSSSVRKRGERRRVKNLAQARRSSRVAEIKRRAGDER